MSRGLLLAAAILGIAACQCPAQALGCANEQVRLGPSADLPDCRAYELVTPAASPNGGLTGSITAFDRFSSPPAALSGEGFLFTVAGGALPGTDGAGFINTYRASRGADGWHSSLVGPAASEATAAYPGGFSADQSLLSFEVGQLENRPSGSLALAHSGGTIYVRNRDGRFSLVGEGALPVQPDSDGNPDGFADELRPRLRWIAANGDHVIFSQREDPVRLLPDAPPDGVAAIYDRANGALRIASLLPGNVPPSSPSEFEGASADGSTILFRTEGTLYARLDGERTVPVATGTVQAAGASADGGRIFYVEGAEGSGDLYSFVPASGQRIKITAGGNARFVNIAPDGSRVYFESSSVLNADGTVAASSAGPPRLYVWDGSSVAFITSVSQEDLARASPVGELGLTQWVRPVGTDAPARNSGFLLETSRTNWNGTSFAFESDADIGGDNPGGKLEIYRYQTKTGSIECVSCVEGLAVGDAAFADYSLSGVDASTVIPNLSEDGSTVFFQTAAPLLPRDSNGEMDVYEWHDGNLALISTGQDSGASLLMGATPAGNDVFVRTAQRLVPEGQGPGIPAVYDARVGGGFAASLGSPVCSLESCQMEPPAEAAPAPPASALFTGPGNRRRHKSERRRKCRRPRAPHRRCVKGRHAGPSRQGR